MSMYPVDKLVVVTGLSGSGKSSTLNLLEDQGLFAVDNIPAALLPQLLNLLKGHESAVANGVVAVMDIRSRDLRKFPSVVRALRNEMNFCRVLFLDSTDEVLVQRFKTTRRSHPLGDHLPIMEGIRQERELLAPIRDEADVIIDTSKLDLRSLRAELLRSLGEPQPHMTVILSSFGFKHGIPSDSDYVLDVRFLPNPYYVQNLRQKDGRDNPVKKYIQEQCSDLDEILNQTGEYLTFLLPRYARLGKNSVHIAVGCTGGRHRSVAVVEWLTRRLRGEGFVVSPCHRDVGKL
ncbi:MAG: RNase adapter RapZ [Dethiosulfovibrio peptidovorans]|nr:MAG: RNase adapter RapZ [Dethiosulfovibrio peptidovorans]